MAKIQKIKGFSDLFEAESAKFTCMEDAARRVFSRYGYGELRVPVLEKTELFQKSIGEDTDVVGKEMFTFIGRKGESLTLRPEATAGVVRAFVESGAHQPGQVAKYFSFGPMFRYERPQKGRQRQFHQIDAEIFGAAEPAADAELILMLRSFLTEIGLSKLNFELNSLGCRECRPGYRQALTDFFAGLDSEKLCEDCRRRMHTNPLRVLDCKVPGCKELVAAAPQVNEHLCVGCRSHFDAVLELLDAAGVAYTLNPRLVRGLDYYVRTAFEVTSGDIGAQSSVAGGGRYDGLVANLGGPDVPGVGFACGMERLAMLLPEAAAKGLDFYVAVTDPRAVHRGLLLAERLRAAGLTGEASFEAGSMKSRLRAANRLNARHCLILGQSEFDANALTLKDMGEGGSQETLPVEGALRRLVG
ncbi:MAG: histidine--tRNA ligase [Desulfovibrionaceae bacterium]